MFNWIRQHFHQRNNLLDALFFTKHYFVKYKNYFLMIFLISLFFNSAIGYILYYINKIVDNKELLATSIFKLTFGILFLSVASFTFQTLQTKLQLKIEKSVVDEIIQAIIKSRNFNQQNLSDIFTQLLNDSRVIPSFIVSYFVQIPKELLLFILVICILMYYAPFIALLLITAFAVIGGAVYLMNRGIRRGYKTVKQRVIRLYEKVIDIFYGQEVIKAQGYEDYFVERFEGSWQNYTSLFLNTKKSEILIKNILEIISYILIILWGLFVSESFSLKQITVGNIVLGTVSGVAVYNSFRRIVSSQMSTNQAIISILHIKQFLEKNQSAEHSDSAEPAAFTASEPGFDGSIRIANLTLRFDSRTILNNIDLTINPGEKVAIVGETGIGKTSLVRTLLGLYPDFEGRIFFGDIDVLSPEFNNYKKYIGYISQSPFLFHSTIRENVLVGRQAPQDNKLKILLGDLYARLDEHINGSTNTLSGGQRQKIILARNLIRDTKIIIFDEPTAHLDSATEIELFNQFEEFLNDRTVILIAHKSTWIDKMDRIYKLVDGNLIESVH